jgi:hypothetical protein
LISTDHNETAVVHQCHAVSNNSNWHGWKSWGKNIWLTILHANLLWSGLLQYVQVFYYLNNQNKGVHRYNQI